MKNISKNTLIFFILGIISFSLGFIINHYVSLSDFNNGLTKGISIGLFILSMIAFVKNRNQQALR